MVIAPVDSSKDLNALVEELGEHTEVESMGVGEESNDEVKNVSMKEQRDCKKLIILFLRKLESIQEWLR